MHSLIGAYNTNRIHIGELWNFVFGTTIDDTQETLSFLFALIQQNITVNNTQFRNWISWKWHLNKTTGLKILLDYSSVISKLHGIKRGMWWRSWLRHRPKIPKIVGSIPNSDTGIFHCLNPSGRTMVFESTQPLTEMSTMDIPFGAKVAGA